MTENTENTEPIDIVALVQNNPLTRLSHDYGSKIVQKIRERFTQEEQQFFVANFYCYYNYDQKKDFVIILDLIWKWLGYSRVDHCKTVLLKNFKENVDYKIEKEDGIYFPEVAGKKTEPVKEQEKTETRGRKPERITLTVNCFKKLCLKSRTEQADKIHDYYVELENTMNELVAEQAEELRIKLEQTTKNTNKKITDTFIDCYNDENVLYIIKIAQDIYKFGICDERFKKRFSEHKSTFGHHIIPVKIYKTLKNKTLEKAIKQDSVISPYIIKKVYNDTNQTELIKTDTDFTYDILLDRIEKLLQEVEKDDYLIKQNEQLKLENEQLKLQLEKGTTDKITKEKNKEIGQLKTEHTVLLKQIKETPFQARNILTGEIINFKSFADARNISGIGPHSIVNNYLDKPKQHSGFVYYSENKPYWKPPHNYKFDINVKPSTHMIMCKSINKESGEITYYNSIKEASKIIGLEDNDSTMRKFIWLCSENKESNHEILKQYKWYKVHTCGSWIYPDGKEEQIDEKLIIKKPNEKGEYVEDIVSLENLTDISDNNQKLLSNKARKKTTERFIEEAKQIYGDTYDYSLVKYINSRTKVNIICKIHGNFEQTPDRHLHSNGCRKCL